MLRSPGETQASFKLLRPFVPFSTDDSKRNLQAFMTGQQRSAGLRLARRLRSAIAEDGPFTVSNTMNTEASVSQQLSLLNIEGTDVVFGDLQMVPLAGGLLWVRPVYVQPTVSRLARVAADDRVGAGLAEQPRRVRQFAQRRAGEAVPRLRRQHRRRRR